MKKTILLAAVAAVAMATSSEVWAKDKMKVVTTFTVIADMAAKDRKSGV